MGARKKIEKLCATCGEPIGRLRLEALPGTVMCVKCAELFPPPPVDVGRLEISEASPITRNGFGVKD